MQVRTPRSLAVSRPILFLPCVPRCSPASPRPTRTRNSRPSNRAAVRDRTVAERFVDHGVSGLLTNRRAHTEVRCYRAEIGGTANPEIAKGVRFSLGPLESWSTAAIVPSIDAVGAPLRDALLMLSPPRHRAT